MYSRGIIELDESIELEKSANTKIVIKLIRDRDGKESFAFSYFYYDVKRESWIPKGSKSWIINKLIFQEFGMPFLLKHCKVT